MPLASVMYTWSDFYMCIYDGHIMCNDKHRFAKYMNKMCIAYL